MKPEGAKVKSFRVPYNTNLIKLLHKSFIKDGQVATASWGCVKFQLCLWQMQRGSWSQSWWQVDLKIRLQGLRW